MAQAIYMHYIYSMSWDSISKRNGLLLTIDKMHQNSTGSNMIADLIKSFLEK